MDVVKIRMCFQQYGMPVSSSHLAEDSRPISQKNNWTRKARPLQGVRVIIVGITTGFSLRPENVCYIRYFFLRKSVRRLNYPHEQSCSAACIREVRERAAAPIGSCIDRVVRLRGLIVEVFTRFMMPQPTCGR